MLPAQENGYPIIYVDKRDECFCSECAEGREELTPHLLEGCEEPISCSDCGCDV